MGRKPRVRAAERKAQQLGLADGLTKRQLDAANANAKVMFGVGIGVIVMESETARSELAKCRWWEWRKKRTWRAEQAFWQGRFRAVTDRLASDELAR